MQRTIKRAELHRLELGLSLHASVVKSRLAELMRVLERMAADAPHGHPLKESDILAQMKGWNRDVLTLYLRALERSKQLTWCYGCLEGWRVQGVSRY